MYSGPSAILVSSIRQLVLSGLVMTVQLECFAESVCFSKVFELNKGMGF